MHPLDTRRIHIVTAMRWHFQYHNYSPFFSVTTSPDKRVESYFLKANYHYFGFRTHIITHFVMFVKSPINKNVSLFTARHLLANRTLGKKLSCRGFCYIYICLKN